MPRSLPPSAEAANTTASAEAAKPLGVARRTLLLGGTAATLLGLEAASRADATHGPGLAASARLASDAASAPAADSPLRVVTDAHAAPISFLDAQGQARGLAVELWRQLVLRANIGPASLVAMPRANALQAFASGAADVLLDAVRGDERVGDPLHTRPYQALTHVLVSRLMGRHYGSLHDCRGQRLALVHGHAWGAQIKRRHPSITQLSAPSHAEVATMVLQGRADVGLVANEYLQPLLQERGTGELAITGLLPEVALELVMAVRRPLTHVHELLKQAQARLPPEWVMAERERWLGQPRSGSGLLNWRQVSEKASPLLFLVGGAAVGSSWWIARLRREVRRRRDAERAMQTSRDSEAAAAAHRKRFISFLSHESRSLVAGIVGGLELLAHGDDAPLRQRLMDGLRANASGLRQLLDESLDAAAIDAGAVSVRLRPVRLRCLFKPLHEQASALAALRRLTLDVELGAAGELRVLADPLRLAQALRNLIFNALKFTASGGVRVSAQAVQADAEPRVRIEVADTGCGMTAEEMARLFRPFSQVSSAASAFQPGSGLGLAISLELVRRMGGTLVVASTPGQGSAFSIELPAVVEPKDVATAATATSVAAVGPPVPPSLGQPALAD